MGGLPALEVDGAHDFISSQVDYRKLGIEKDWLTALSLPASLGDFQNLFDDLLDRHR